ncbi:hypothetical protein LTR62_007005 [Meristemomyces frigidus]|uniref:Origin recognition complex subunit 2 n=1 Tax=Meristemomyces frigidus TaxID=1508187 RepID=A0AAN7TCY1_9PEZI|nr:hypothetical protein LTR62_007005 [Meristemomyces frigidus]
MVKRRRGGDDAGAQEETPRKTRRATRDEASVPSPQVDAATPSGRKSILRATPSKPKGTASLDPTPKSLRKVLFSTPAKHEEAEAEDSEDTPTAATRTDRSARRKSQRTLLHVDDASDDEEAIVQNELLAQRILGDDDESEDEVGEDECDVVLPEPQSGLDTPSKTGKLRGRPKGRRRERTPSPPPDLPPHELYFFQNRAGANKTSTNTLPSHLLLGHDDYFAKIAAFRDRHADDIVRLEKLHRRAFEQWMFELEEGFNLCLYGYGSKRGLAMEFASELYATPPSTRIVGRDSTTTVHGGTQAKRNIVVVNGYTPGLTTKDILATLAKAALPPKAQAALPAQPAAMLESMLDSLDTTIPSAQITLLIHSLDHPNLRKPAIQATIARFAAHPLVQLITTCDSPLFPLLWDTATTRQFKFLYHDTTTFQPYRVELDVVEEVNALLGRTRRRVGGKDGVVFVLRSLPENARNLFKILVVEQLALADAGTTAASTTGHGDGFVGSDEETLGASDDDLAAAGQDTPSRRGRGKYKRAPEQAAKRLVAPSHRPVALQGLEGVEYRTLYHKAVEEFVCSSELNFRTLLKEFVDHQIIESRKDGLGVERVSVVGVGREELEGLLEEL